LAADDPWLHKPCWAARIYMPAARRLAAALAGPRAAAPGRLRRASSGAGVAPRALSCLLPHFAISLIKAPRGAAP